MFFALPSSCHDILAIMPIQQEFRPVSFTNDTASKAFRTIKLVKGNVLARCESSILAIEFDITSGRLREV
jgi:hypothetical protein